MGSLWLASCDNSIEAALSYPCRQTDVVESMNSTYKKDYVNYIMGNSVGNWIRSSTRQTTKACTSIPKSSVDSNLNYISESIP